MLYLHWPKMYCACKMPICTCCEHTICITISKQLIFFSIGMVILISYDFFFLKFLQAFTTFQHKHLILIIKPIVGGVIIWVCFQTQKPRNLLVHNELQRIGWSWVVPGLERCYIRRNGNFLFYQRTQERWLIAAFYYLCARRAVTQSQPSSLYRFCVASYRNQNILHGCKIWGPARLDLGPWIKVQLPGKLHKSCIPFYSWLYSWPSCDAPFFTFPHSHSAT